MFLRGETLSPLNLFLCWALHELDPHPHLMPLIVSIQITTKCGYLYSLLNCPVFTNLSFRISSNWVLTASKVNWTEKCLVVTLTHWPEFSCLDHKAHHFLFPQRRPSDIWKWWPLLHHYHPPNPTIPFTCIPMEVISPLGSSYFQWVINQKCLVPFFSLMAKSLWFTMKDCFWILKMKGWVDQQQTSFSGVLQTQSHSTSFKWHMGKEKEIAFMECLLCFGHITVIKSRDLCSNPLKCILLYPIL